MLVTHCSEGGGSQEEAGEEIARVSGCYGFEPNLDGCYGCSMDSLGTGCHGVIWVGAMGTGLRAGAMGP